MQDNSNIFIKKARYGSTGREIKVVIYGKLCNGDKSHEITKDDTV